jgi:hypothetical protein
MMTILCKSFAKSSRQPRISEFQSIYEGEDGVFVEGRASDNCGNLFELTTIPRFSAEKFCLSTNIECQKFAFLIADSRRNFEGFHAIRLESFGSREICNGNQ